MRRGLLIGALIFLLTAVGAMAAEEFSSELPGPGLATKDVGLTGAVEAVVEGAVGAVQLTPDSQVDYLQDRKSERVTEAEREIAKSQEDNAAVAIENYEELKEAQEAIVEQAKDPALAAEIAKDLTAITAVEENIRGTIKDPAIAQRFQGMTMGESEMYALAVKHFGTEDPGELAKRMQAKMKAGMAFMPKELRAKFETAGLDQETDPKAMMAKMRKLMAEEGEMPRMSMGTSMTHEMMLNSPHLTEAMKQQMAEWKSGAMIQEFEGIEGCRKLVALGKVKANCDQMSQTVSGFMGGEDPEQFINSLPEDQREKARGVVYASSEMNELAEKLYAEGKSPAEVSAALRSDPTFQQRLGEFDKARGGFTVVIPQGVDLNAVTEAFNSGNYEKVRSLGVSLPATLPWQQIQQESQKVYRTAEELEGLSQTEVFTELPEDQQAQIKAQIEQLRSAPPPSESGQSFTFEGNLDEWLKSDQFKDLPSPVQESIRAEAQKQSQPNE